MKKTILLLVILSLIIPLALAEPNLEIEKIDKGSVILSELDNPAKFEFIIDNKGEPDVFQIYSLISVSMGPKGFFDLPHGKTKIDVLAFPDKSIREKNLGFFNFEYQLKGQNSGIFKDSLLIKIVKIEDVLEISAEPLSIGESTATIIIKNKENTNLEKVQINFASLFFSSTESITLDPLEEIRISVPVGNNLEKIAAGPYIISATINIEENKAKIEGIIEYLEKEGTSVLTQTDGLIIKKKTITKTNKGNVPTTASIEIKKDIVSRLFTVNSQEPDSTTRTGLSVTYTWRKDISPSESFSITSTTNYTFPFILIILIVLVGLLAKIYSTTPLTIKKSVSLVKTKGGEFALKVTLKIKTRKHVDKVQLIDSLPRMTKLYEKFGRKPDRIDEHSNRLFWEIPFLNRGESRIYSYVIYSKMNIVGRFELPAATAILEYNGKTMEIFSNRAYFASEETD